MMAAGSRWWIIWMTSGQFAPTAGTTSTWSISQPDCSAAVIVASLAICPLGTAHSMNSRRRLAGCQWPDPVSWSRNLMNPLP